MTWAIHHADYRDVPMVGNVLVWDPPWDAHLVPPRGPFDSVIAFGDGASGERLVRLAGQCNWPPIAWIFVWDCVTSWYTRGRPLRRYKACWWFGNVSRAAHDAPLLPRPSRRGYRSNSRGRYYSSGCDGTQISDLYHLPITRLHGRDGAHRHAKPLEWVMYIIGMATMRGDTVVDPCAGSGVVGVACRSMGRSYVGAEIDAATHAAAMAWIAGTTGAFQPPQGAAQLSLPDVIEAP